MPTTTIKYFKYEHLKGDLRTVSEKMSKLANEMEEMLPDGPEKSAGMRELLIAKDCFVRAMLPDEG